jgi:hypothetical protein
VWGVDTGCAIPASLEQRHNPSLKAQPGFASKILKKRYYLGQLTLKIKALTGAA